MAFNNNFIDDLKSRIDIVDVIGRELPLKKAGSSYKCLCPFHSEKTPSFNVNQEHQYFHCFGCGEKGDVIRFVERYFNLDFMDAVQKLCEEYNIPMPEKIGGSKTDYSKYYEINRKAAMFFFKQLTSGPNPGYSYIRKRGLTDQTIVKFGLGYAPDRWDALLQNLKGQGVSESDMLKLGLISKGKRGYYDKFRNRVIFPIIDVRGKVIGFGGRAIGDFKPKYLNSSESDIFLKKNNLYALNITKKDIADQDRVLMVEGYMDVISLYQHGIRNVTASLGTALTENQGRLIRRYTNNVVLSYDSDAAGVNAALRGIGIIRKAGCSVRVLQIDDGKDPDEFVRKNGKDAFEKLIEKAVPATDFRLKNLEQGFDFSTDTQIIDYIQRCVPILQGLSPVEQNLYVRKLAEKFNISEYAIQSEIRAGTESAENAAPIRRYRTAGREERKDQGTEIRMELSFLILCIENKDYLRRIEEDGVPFRTGIGRKVFAILKPMSEETTVGTMGLDEEQVFRALDPEEERLLREAMNEIRIGPDDEKFYLECRTAYQLNRYREKKVELQNSLKVVEGMDDDPGKELEMERIAGQLMELEQKIQKLREK